jgi:hypothetical protein
MAGVATFLLVLANAGCYESRFPIDMEPRAPIDQDLVARWRCLPAAADADTAAATITIGVARDGVYAASFQEDGKAADVYEIHASVLEGQSVLNIRDLAESKREPWVFGRYVFLRPDVLQVQILLEEALDDELETPAALREALEKRIGRADLFGDYCTCVRIKNPG